MERKTEKYCELKGCKLTIFHNHREDTLRSNHEIYKKHGIEDVNKAQHTPTPWIASKESHANGVFPIRQVRTAAKIEALLKAAQNNQGV